MNSLQNQILQIQQHQVQSIFQNNISDKNDEGDDLNQKNQNQALNGIIDELFDNEKLLNDYSSHKYIIYKELKKKNYTIESHLDSGGEADIFNGYFQNDQGIKEQYVFKVYFQELDESLNQEIDILKVFEKPINVVRIIDSLQVDQFYISVLEKYQYNLKQEFMLFYERKVIFSFEKLLQIIFDLIDGLIEFRIYNIIHLDIKPANILISKSGNYVYADFGSSYNLQKNKEIEIVSYTPNFASPEIINDEVYIDYQADVYSLGKTLKQVLIFFGEVNSDYIEHNIKIKELILNFDRIIDENMILDESQSRLKCQNLHGLFLSYLKIEEYKQFFLNYQNKLNQINNLYQYDCKKDIPYFLNLKLQYNILNLELNQRFQRNDLLKNDQNNSIEKQQSDVQSKLNDLQLSEQQVMEKHISQDSQSLIAESLSNVGQCYIDIGDNQNGLKYKLQSLLMRKQQYNESHPSIVTSLNSVGLCYINLGDSQTGLKYVYESLEMGKQMFERNHPEIATSLYNLGYCYKNMGDIKNGLKYSLQSLKMRKQLFKGNHHDIAESLNNVGFCFRTLGDYKTCLKYQLQSLEMRKQIFKITHPDIAQSMFNVGFCYEMLGDYLKSLKYQLESLEIRIQIYHENHPDIADSLYNVGLQYMNIGENLIGLHYLLESLQTRKQILQKNHPNIALSHYAVGLCYIKIGDYQNSLKYLQESLGLIKLISHGNHPDIAYSLHCIGQCYKYLGDYKKSLIYYLQSLIMRKQMFKRFHHSIAISLKDVVACYKLLGDNKNYLKQEQNLEEMEKQIQKQRKMKKQLE